MSLVGRRVSRASNLLALLNNIGNNRYPMIRKRTIQPPSFAILALRGTFDALDSND